MVVEPVRGAGRGVVAGDIDDEVDAGVGEDVEGAVAPEAHGEGVGPDLLGGVVEVGDVRPPRVARVEGHVAAGLGVVAGRRPADVDRGGVAHERHRLSGDAAGTTARAAPPLAHVR